jgi:hypothetical protein
MDFDSAIDWDEAFEYAPGLLVELKAQPGVVDTIAGYDLMMVPPIWLENDPCPRYPHELQVVSRSRVKVCNLSEEASQGDGTTLGSSGSLLQIR